MKKSFKLSEEAFQMDGKMPLSQAIPLGLQHFGCEFPDHGVYLILSFKSNE